MARARCIALNNDVESIHGKGSRNARNVVLSITAKL